jgi:putative peptidoglycan lipid II flippase
MLRSSSYITLLTLAGSAVSFFAQLAIAQRFGVGIDVDAYFFALGIPTFIAGMVSAILSYNLIPRIVACEGSPSFHRQYMGSIFIITILVPLLVIPLVEIILKPLQIFLLPLGSSIRGYPNIDILVFLAWLVGSLQVIQGCLSALLNSVRKYYSCAAMVFFPYTGMLIYLMTSNNSLGISGVLVALILGTSLAIIASTLLLRRFLFPLPVNKILWSEVRTFSTSAPFTAIAMVCFTSYAIVDSYWAPRAGEGVLASLSYAQRLVISLGSLLVAGPSAILVPRLSQSIQRGDFISFHRLLCRALYLVGGGGIFIAILVLFLSERLLIPTLKNGFGDNEIRNIFANFHFMSPGMVAMLLSVVLMRALFCLNDGAKLGAIVGALWPVIYFCASFSLYKYGSLGISLGYTLTWLLIACTLFLAIKWLASRQAINFHKLSLK